MENKVRYLLTSLSLITGLILIIFLATGLIIVDNATLSLVVYGIGIYFVLLAFLLFFYFDKITRIFTKQ